MNRDVSFVLVTLCRIVLNACKDIISIEIPINVKLVEITVLSALTPNNVSNVKPVTICKNPKT